MNVLVFAAHPDDEVLGMGGTIAVHVDRGDAITVVCLTDGSSTQYPDDPILREQKNAEAQAAANKHNDHLQDFSNVCRRDLESLAKSF